MLKAKLPNQVGHESAYPLGAFDDLQAAGKLILLVADIGDEEVRIGKPIIADAINLDCCFKIQTKLR